METVEMVEKMIPAMVSALGIAVLLVLLGELMGGRLPLLRKVFLPGSVLGGVIALLMGLQVLSPSLPEVFPDLERVYSVLQSFPSLFINVVFACLLLGKPMAGFATLWKKSYRQVIMGHVFAWGQYVVGLALVLFVLSPFLGLSELAGPVIAMGFQGGHGTAAGLSGTFADLGFEGGVTIAYAVATFGIVAGAIGGPILATILDRRSSIKRERQETDQSPGGNRQNEKDEKKSELSPLTGRLTVHLALVASVILVGWLFLKGIVFLESSIRGIEAQEAVTGYIPLFSVVLLVGFGTQFLLQGLGWDRLFDRPVLDLISAFALDMVIFSALATLKLSVIGEYWVAIVALCAAGLGWNLAVLFTLGKRIYPSPWHPYGLGDFGGGTATTASGLLLISITDPARQTDALEAYSGKQPFYEPFMGGGLVTAFALPIVATWGAGIALAVTGAILSIWLCLAFRFAAK